MNDTTRKILAFLLTDEKNWEWEGRGKSRTPTKPRYAKIESEYWRAWEYLFVGGVQLPQLYRAYHLLKVLQEGHPSYKMEPEHVESHFGLALVDGVERVTLECDDCLIELQMHMSDSQYAYPGMSFTDWWLWQHQDWTPEEITQEMVDGLATAPDTDYQQVLF